MSRKKTTEQFIAEARLVHGNFYDYSKTKYLGSREPVEIICPKHGSFFQLACNHLNQKKGCIQCSIEKHSGPKKMTTEQFIAEAKKVHQNPDGTPKYDYSVTEFFGVEYYLKIICPKHGLFYQKAVVHLRGSGCSRCGQIKNSQKRTHTTETFVSNAMRIHQDENGNALYNYDKVEYHKANEKVIVTCPIHGDFSITPANHLNGSACPACAATKGSSKLEKEVLTYIKNLPAMENITILENDRTALDGYELDIYIPEKKLAIEFDGIYFHSEEFKDRNYHLWKTTECEKRGIRLIHIWENEWTEKQNIVKSRLKQILGCQSTRIFARKCFIKPLPLAEEKPFFINNHIQGFIHSNICYGLVYNFKGKQYLVAAMSFGELRKNLGSKAEANTYELYRFATQRNITVVGGASRLFKYFLKRHKPSKVISFADRRYSSTVGYNTLYSMLGFKFDSTTNPSYFYIIPTKESPGYKLINRFGLRKDVLISKYGCTPEQTEHGFCKSMGWWRIYDVGCLKYVWESSEIKNK